MTDNQEGTLENPYPPTQTDTPLCIVQDKSTFQQMLLIFTVFYAR